MSRVTVTCPSCAKTFHVDAGVIGKQGECGRCKHVFTLHETTETYKLAEPSVPRVERDVPNCPSCAEELSPDAVICTGCGLDLRTGKRLETATSDASPVMSKEVAPDSQQSVPRRPILPILAMLFGMAAGVCFVIFIWNTMAIRGLPCRASDDESDLYEVSATPAIAIPGQTMTLKLTPERGRATGRNPRADSHRTALLTQLTSLGGRYCLSSGTAEFYGNPGDVVDLDQADEKKFGREINASAKTPTERIAPKVSLRLPDQRQWHGQEMRVKLRLSVRRAVAIGKRFEVRQGLIETWFTIRFATETEKARYATLSQSFRYSGAAAGTCALVALVLSAWHRNPPRRWKSTTGAKRPGGGLGGALQNAPAHAGSANAAVVWVLVGLGLALTTYIFGISDPRIAWPICVAGAVFGLFGIVEGVYAARRAKHDPTLPGSRVRVVVAIALGALLLCSLPLRAVMPALLRASQLAHQQSQSSSLKNVGVALRAYATDHDGSFPPDWTTLVDNGYANKENTGRDWTAAELDAAFEYMPGLSNRDPRPVLAVARPGDDETHVQALHVDGHVDRESYEDWQNRNWSRYPKAMHANAASGNGTPASSGDLLVTEYAATGGRCLVHRFSSEGEYRGVFARGPEHEGAQRFWDITFAPDSLLLFVSYDRDPTAASALLRFDGTTGALISTDAPPGGFQGHAPRGLTFGPDGHLYVCTWSKEGGGLFEYDLEADVWNEIEEVTATNPRDVAFAPNGNLLLTASNEKHVREYERDGSKWTLHRTIPVTKLNGPEGLWAKPTGEVYVCSLGNDRVIQFDYDDPSQTRSFACSTLDGPTYATIAPNGDLITAAYSPSSGPVIRILDDGSCTDFSAMHLHKPIGLAFKP